MIAKYRDVSILIREELLSPVQEVNRAERVATGEAVHLTNGSRTGDSDEVWEIMDASAGGATDKGRSLRFPQWPTELCSQLFAGRRSVNVDLVSPAAEEAVLYEDLLCPIHGDTAQRLLIGFL